MEYKIIVRHTGLRQRPLRMTLFHVIANKRERKHAWCDQCYVQFETRLSNVGKLVNELGLFMTTTSFFKKLKKQQQRTG